MLLASALHVLLRLLGEVLLSKGSCADTLGCWRQWPTKKGLFHEMHSPHKHIDLTWTLNLFSSDIFFLLIFLNRSMPQIVSGKDPIANYGRMSSFDQRKGE